MVNTLTGQIDRIPDNVVQSLHYRLTKLISFLVKKCAECLSGYKGEERLFYRDFLGGDLANCATQTVVYDKTCT